MHERSDDLARAVLAVVTNGASHPYAFLEHDHRVAVALALGYSVLVIGVIDGAVFDALVVIAIHVEIAVEVFLPPHSLFPAVAAATVVGLEEVAVVVVPKEVAKHLLELAVDDQGSLLAYELAHIIQVFFGIAQFFELCDGGLLDPEVLLGRSLVEELEIIVLQLRQFAVGKRASDGELGHA